jgi:hypothetical protein
VLEYLYFQNLSNTKRCSGRPRFLNAYSDWIKLLWINLWLKIIFLFYFLIVNRYNCYFYQFKYSFFSNFYANNLWNCDYINIK